MRKENETKLSYIRRLGEGGKRDAIWEASIEIAKNSKNKKWENRMLQKQQREEKKIRRKRRMRQVGWLACGFCMLESTNKETDKTRR